MFRLVAIGGALKGASWPVGDDAVTIGRSAGCDVKLSEPVVSRHHCILVRRGDGIVLNDLGALNPALVNGAPCRNATLGPGDELALGKDLFMVVYAPDIPVVHAPTEYAAEAPSVGVSELVASGTDDAEISETGRPRTVEDLAEIYDGAQQFGRAETFAALVETLVERIGARFNPIAWWLARVEADELVLVAESGGRAQPREALETAARTRRATLYPTVERRGGEDVYITTMVTPVVLGGMTVAVIAVQTDSSRTVYVDDDLRVFILLGKSVAPFIHSVETVDQLRRDNDRLRAHVGARTNLVGVSRAMARLLSQAARAAECELPVLILGETGTGKELVARYIHEHSARQDAPLIIVNCAAIPRELFEGELFGHEKGAFTGAHETSEGLLQLADGGSLFLDEVGELCPEHQARLLRAIESGSFRRIGAEQETRVDIRVIAATNRDLLGAIRAGGFRRDLYHRLNAFEIAIAPLRERPSDIPVLAEHFFEEGRERARRPLLGISPAAIEYLKGRAWPGNVRELRNVILRAIAVARGQYIELDDVQVLDGADGGLDAPQSLAEIERVHITRILQHCGGNVREAASVLGIGRSTLYKKIQDFGIRLDAE